MWWKLGLLLFVLFGLVIGALSLYAASVSGLMQKVGLVESDFSVAVSPEKLAALDTAVTHSLACDLPSRMRGALSHFLAGDDVFAEISFRLGHDRISCGGAMLARGEVEVGTYEVIKGMGYLSRGYSYVLERAEVDDRVCEALPTPPTAETVNLILSATSGRVYQIISEEWMRLGSLKTSAHQLCLDQ